MAELNDMLTGSVDAATARGVDVDMLDYEYVNKCTDPKVLRSILATLRSGSEGHYPELEKHTEEKLLSLIPESEKKKILRLRAQTTAAELQEAEIELQQWQHKITAKEKGLLQHNSDRASSAASGTKTTTTATNTGVGVRTTFDKPHLPPVRGSKHHTVTVNDTAAVAGTKTSNTSGNHHSPTGSAGSSKESKAISGYNFRAWDKFDVDQALASMDEEEDRRLKAEQEQIAKHTAATMAEANAARRRSKLHQDELAKLLDKLKVSEMSDVQRSTIAERERLKGNEFFRAKEFDKAYDSYSLSLALDSRNKVVYANRAIACSKLEKFDTAEDDCSRALHLDPTFVKAWYRRGAARFKKGKYIDAARDFANAINLEPHNKDAYDLFGKCQAKIAEVEGRSVTLDDLLKSIRGTNANVSISVVEVDGSTGRLNSTKLSTSVNAEFALKADDCLNNVPVLGVASLAELVVQSSILSSELIGSGVSIVGSLLLPSDKPSVSGSEESIGSNYTRIVIADDDDDDEDEEEEEVGNRGNIEESIPSESMTRIQIVDDDDEEDEESETERVRSESDEEKQSDTTTATLPSNDISSSSTQQFTRIAIQEEDSDSESDAEDVPVIPAAPVAAVDSPPPPPQVAPAEHWKDVGNKFAAQGRWADAVHAYTESLQIDPAFHPSRSNRVLAYIQTQNYGAAIADAELVLAQDSQNVKLMNRLAWALHANADSKDPLKEETIAGFRKAMDVSARVLRVDPSNADAMARMDSLSSSLTQASSKWKDFGNEAIKGSQFTSAVEAYSRAIDLDKDNIVAYNNRSQACIKLMRFADADRDASFVIENANRVLTYDNSTNQSSSSSTVESNVKKAYFRRALARRAMGGAGNVDAALTDLKTLLSMEPDNKQAEIELAKTEQLMREHSLKKKQPLPPSSNNAPTASVSTKTTISEGHDNDSDGLLKAVSSRRKPLVTLAEPPAPVATPVPSPSSISSPQQSKELSASPQSPVKAPKKPLANANVVSELSENDNADGPRTPVQQPSSLSNSNSNSKSRSKAKKSTTPSNATPTSTPAAAAVPTEPPKTAYELERIWRSLKTRPELVCEYLKCFKKSTCKKIFTKGSVSSDLLSSLLHSLLTHGSTELAVKILAGITETPNFSMTIALLPEEDEACIQKLFAKMAEQSTSATQLEEVKDLMMKFIGGIVPPTDDGR